MRKFKNGFWKLRVVSSLWSEKLKVWKSSSRFIIYINLARTHPTLEPQFLALVTRHKSIILTGWIGEFTAKVRWIVTFHSAASSLRSTKIMPAMNEWLYELLAQRTWVLCKVPKLVSFSSNAHKWDGVDVSVEGQEGPRARLQREKVTFVPVLGNYRRSLWSSPAKRAGQGDGCEPPWLSWW